MDDPDVTVLLKVLVLIDLSVVIGGQAQGRGHDFSEGGGGGTVAADLFTVLWAQRVNCRRGQGHAPPPPPPRNIEFEMSK